MKEKINTIIKKEWVVTEDFIGTRLDQYLSKHFPDHSRATIQQWIKHENITVNNSKVKCKFLLKGFEKIAINLTLEDRTEYKPQHMDLDIQYEDSDLMILNKPAGLVVHPGSGNPDHTLLNGLLAYSEKQRKLTRAGIVHRLDKDTSGLMVVAKNGECQQKLINLLKDHNITREYTAIVKGRLNHDGVINQPIGRHPKQRIKMAVNLKGKKAITHYFITTSFKHFTQIKLQLETGRTHQIRVHMHHLGHTLVGDPLYGNPHRIASHIHNELKPFIRGFPRQALHAKKLEFIHPITQKSISVSAPPPNDLITLIDELHSWDNIDPYDEEIEIEYAE